MKVRIIIAFTLGAALTACWSGNSNWSITSTKIDSEFDALTPAEVDVQASLESLRAHNLDKALVQVESALEKDPDLVSGLNVAGLIYEQLGAVNLAEIHFNNAIRVDRNDPITRNNYGTFLCNLGRIYEAEAQFVIAANNPDYRSSEEAYTNAGLCARKVPDVDRAAYYFQAALQKNPKYGPALFQLAGLNFQDGRFLQARQDIARYLESGDPDEKGLWLAARIERELSNRVGVIFYSEQLRERFPNSQEAKLASDLETKLTGESPRKPLPRELQAMVDREKTESAQFEDGGKSTEPDNASPGRGVSLGELAQIPPATSILETLPGGPKQAPATSKTKKESSEDLVFDASPAPQTAEKKKGKSKTEKSATAEAATNETSKTGIIARNATAMSQAPATSALQDESWITAQRSGNYTLALHSEADLDTLNAYIKSNGIEGGPLGYYRYEENGEPRFGLVYGSYRSEQEAQKARERLPRTVAAEGPGIKQFAKLQLANELALQSLTTGGKAGSTAQTTSSMSGQNTESLILKEGEGLADGATTPLPLPPLPDRPERQTPNSVKATPKPGMGIAVVQHEDWLLSRKSTSFTVQLVADKREDTVLNYARKHKLRDQTALFSFKRDGDTWYALVYGDYDSRAEARQAAQGITGSTAPWVRSLNEVQTLIRTSRTQ